jgi:hypothetical protein
MHLTEFATFTVLIPRCLRYVNATLFLILTDPSPPATIPTGLGRGELAILLTTFS